MMQYHTTKQVRPPSRAYSVIKPLLDPSYTLLFITPGKCCPNKFQITQSYLCNKVTKITNFLANKKLSIFLLALNNNYIISTNYQNWKVLIEDTLMNIS